MSSIMDLTWTFFHWNGFQMKFIHDFKSPVSSPVPITSPPPLSYPRLMLNKTERSTIDQVLYTFPVLFIMSTSNEESNALIEDHRHTKTCHSIELIKGQR